MASVLILLPVFVGCSQNADSQNMQGMRPVKVESSVVSNEQFRAYWNQGKGEVTRYVLEQARYGEIHTGDAVVVFVTEDFLTDKQVKLESDPAGRGVTPVLKMNFTKKFVTGIYPYSLMTSVFTPIDLIVQPHTLKVTTSVQEWCGHIFTQLNLKGSLYNVQERSYFEREGDREFSLNRAMLEDEVWTRIRLAPERLPVGLIDMIPGTLAARLRHVRLAVEKARATLTPVPGDTTGGLSRYTITYGNGERTLAIDFARAFPHEIVGWSETYSDFGNVLTTRAVRTESIMLDYWTRHSNSDTALRTKLGLDPHR